MTSNTFMRVDEVAEILGISKSYAYKIVKKLNDELNLASGVKGTEFESLTLHQLRHCNATMLLNSGVDIKIVSEHLGHCDIGVTANIYADVLKSTKAKVADLVTLKLT